MNGYTHVSHQEKKSTNESWKLFYERFRYCERTGNLYYKVHVSGMARKGDMVGAIDRKKDGRCYLRTTVNGRKWYVHRIIATMLNGPISDDILIDHRDGNGLNNRPDNLRFADAMLNSANHRRKLPASGCVGVCWWKPKALWKARITVNKDVISLGCFKRLEDAIAARKAAEIEYAWSR